MNKITRDKKGWRHLSTEDAENKQPSAESVGSTAGFSALAETFERRANSYHEHYRKTGEQEVYASYESYRDAAEELRAEIEKAETPRPKAMNTEPTNNAETLGISARAKAALQKAAEGWGLQITYAQWTRIRRGKGVRLGGWAVEVRAADGTQREWAYGYTLAQLYNDMERAAVHCLKTRKPSQRRDECKEPVARKQRAVPDDVADWKRRWAASQTAMHAAKTLEDRKKHERELEAIVAEFNAAKSATGGNDQALPRGGAQETHE